MTVREAAEALEVSRDLVYKLLKAGKLAHERIGLGRGAIRIDPESLEAFRRSCHVPAFDDRAEPAPRRVRGLVIPDTLAEFTRPRGRRRA